MSQFYSCDRCPSYCCSYARIQVTERDVVRLAKRFDVTANEARRRFTKKGEEPGERVLKHQPDAIYGTICQFLDLETRRCTIYESRPSVCRSFPGSARCGYYDFLAFERRTQEDPEWIPSTFNRED